MIPKRFLLISGVALTILFIISTVFFLEQKKREVPSHVAAETESFDSIIVTWVGENEASQFNIYRSEERDGPYQKVGFSNENQYIDRNLSSNREYYYRITQIIDFNESNYSSVASAITNPGRPMGLKAESVDFQEDLELRINLVWDYSVGVEKYNVYRTEDENGLYEKIATTTNEDYTDLDLDPESTYYYVVTQIVEGKESVYSDKVSATTGTVWHCGDKVTYGKKEYGTVQLGEQCWFLENLNLVEGDIDRNCEIERNCYDNDPVNCSIYGGLYDFSSISCGQNFEGMQGVCPSGWRIPTNQDWKDLEIEMGMREEDTEKYGFRGTNEGSKLAGRYDLWKEGPLKQSSVFASSGMNILPGGHQPAFNLRLFYDIGEKSLLWSSTRANDDTGCTYWESAYGVREIQVDNTRIKRDCLLGGGTAQLRCMRDY